MPLQLYWSLYQSMYWLRLQFFWIAKTHFLITHFLKTLNTKPHFHTTFTEPLTLLAKSNNCLKTIWLKIKQCSQIIHTRVKIIKTTDHLLDTTSKNGKHRL